MQSVFLHSRLLFCGSWGCVRYFFIYERNSFRFTLLCCIQKNCLIGHINLQFFFYRTWIFIKIHEIDILYFKHVWGYVRNYSTESGSTIIFSSMRVQQCKSCNIQKYVIMQSKSFEFIVWTILGNWEFFNPLEGYFLYFALSQKLFQPLHKMMHWVTRQHCLSYNRNIFRFITLWASLCNWKEMKIS